MPIQRVVFLVRFIWAWFIIEIRKRWQGNCRKNILDQIPSHRQENRRILFFFVLKIIISGDSEKRDITLNTNTENASKNSIGNIESEPSEEESNEEESKSEV